VVVKENLKAPSTARFPAYSPAFVSGQAGEIIIAAYVDAHNSFGAMIRNTFIVILDAVTKDVKDVIFGT